MNNIKLICFDLDETLINYSSWRELNKALGVSVDEDRRLYIEHKEGITTYDEWNNKLLKIYQKHKNANKEDIIKIVSNYSYNKGAREIIEYLKNKGYKLALISGSFDILVNIVAKELSIEYAKANNTFIFNKDDRLESIISDGYDVEAKAKHLENFCKMLDIDIKECACIADGANDILMFRRTGHGITFKGSLIENEAWKVVGSFEDLKSIF